MNDQTKKDEILPQAAPSAVNTFVGGSPESMPVNLESAPSVEASENQSNNETVKFGEKAKESNLEQNLIKPSVSQQPKPIAIKKEDKPKVFPSVYGYKVPSAMQQSLGTIKSRAGKGDPKKGATWLNVFLDRLLKMQPN